MALSKKFGLLHIPTGEVVQTSYGTLWLEHFRKALVFKYPSTAWKLYRNNVMAQTKQTTFVSEEFEIIEVN